MDLVFYALAALALVIVGWLALTWWNTPETHTFKTVVQDALRDAREIVAPAFGFVRRCWEFAAPRVTNLAFNAVAALDLYIVQTPDLKAALLRTDYGLAALCALNLFVVLSPRTAPSRIPPPDGRGVAAA